MSSLTIHIAPYEGGASPAVAEMRGVLDTGSVEAARQTLEAAVHDGARVLVLDLAEVEYISSAGWSLIVDLARDCRACGGELVLCGMRTEVGEIFELLEFSTLVDAYPDRGAALSAAGVT